MNFRSKVLVCLCFVLFSIKGNSQTFRFIDLQYVLENLPAYEKAQKEVDNQAKKWRNEINQKEIEYQKLEEEFFLEKDLMNDKLIKEKEFYLRQKQKEIISYQKSKFGTEGQIVRLRQRLVKPVQDIIYNKTYEYAKRQNIDVVFFQSKDNITAVYYIKKLDISKEVIKLIKK